ncbi:MAG: winged helix-turn-helix domain-containing protein [Thermoproteota archaeon]|jgi:hypothetical protein|nr:winged helix-turn-helix domain-containing protein [Thermoproteota archaeon]
MTSTLESLHKILKDKTRRKIVRLLSDTGSLGYTDLMNNMDFVSTGTLNYHLKVLGDLLEKDKEGKYLLSEKGKLASRLLTEFPQQNGPDKQRLKIYWLVAAVTMTMFSVLTGYIMNFPIERVLLLILVAQVLAAFTYFIRVKPTITGRVFYIAVGVSVIGSAFWIILINVLHRTGVLVTLVKLGGTDLYHNISLVGLAVCFIIGGFIGDLIGKKTKYKTNRYLDY